MIMRGEGATDVQRMTAEQVAMNSSVRKRADMSWVLFCTLLSLSLSLDAAAEAEAAVVNPAAAETALEEEEEEVEGGGPLSRP